MKWFWILKLWSLPFHAICLPKAVFKNRNELLFTSTKWSSQNIFKRFESTDLRKVQKNKFSQSIQLCKMHSNSSAGIEAKKSNRIYLDYNDNTLIQKQVFQTMIPYLTDNIGVHHHHMHMGKFWKKQYLRQELTLKKLTISWWFPDVFKSSCIYVYVDR